MSTQYIDTRRYDEACASSVTYKIGRARTAAHASSPQLVECRLCACIGTQLPTGMTAVEVDAEFPTTMAATTWGDA